MLVVGIILGFLLIGLLALWILLRLRNIDIWILSYFRQFVLGHKHNGWQQKKVYVCIADHYEPYFGNVTQETARGRVKDWVSQYRQVAGKHTDSTGRHPQHTYFYPEEEYDEWILDQISELCTEDLGDVEIHLHHDDDTAENLASTLKGFKQRLFEKHALLRKDEKGEIVYGFIHGNWALDNSRRDGRWCGVDNELEVLIDTGCLYDMTMPSAPSDTQTSTINSVYFAREHGHRKSHDKGEIARVGKPQESDQLMMIQGPLILNWRSRKLGLMPRIESGELSSDAPPNRQRVELWEKCGIGVEGSPDHLFIKLHTHGLEAQNIEMLFADNGLDKLYSLLEERFKMREGYELYYVTAWEMYRKLSELTSHRSN